MSGTILVVDDDIDNANALAEALRRLGHVASAAGSARECSQRLQTEVVDLVITDVQMPDVSGIELCRELRARYRDLLVLVITGRSSVEVAIEALRAGAYDYITKPATVAAIDLVVSRALDHLTWRRELARLRAVTSRIGDGVAGESDAIRATIDLVKRVAHSDATVLVTGESGTGKELIARALHQLSGRNAEPFVAVNCAAVPANLLESELFGHMRGAFTDAHEARVGLFQLAGRGTIFLDEIGEMALEMQVKILRALQEHKARPVGGDREVRFGARVVASTNRDLEVEVAQGRFRRDLFYRVNVVGIAVPPLRDRGSDVLLLAHYFVRRIAARIAKPVRGITEGAARLLLAYDWPGNVRELENCIERAVALCQLDQITSDDLPATVHEHEPAALALAPLSPDELVTLAEMERRYVNQVLAAFDGNKTRAARALGIHRRSIYRRFVASAG